MKKKMMLYAAMLVITATAVAQSKRLEPLHGATSARLAWYTEMPTTQGCVLFSMLKRQGWTSKPLWIYATDHTELLLKARREPQMDTNIHRLKIEKSDMDSLLSLIHWAVATASYFDVEDYCNIPDTGFTTLCEDCGTMVLQYDLHWALSKDLIRNRKTNVGNLNVIFNNIQDAILENNIDKFKAELPYIYALAETFRSYAPKAKYKLLWW